MAQAALALHPTQGDADMRRLQMRFVAELRPQASTTDGAMAAAFPVPARQRVARTAAVPASAASSADPAGLPETLRAAAATGPGFDAAASRDTGPGDAQDLTVEVTDEPDVALAVSSAASAPRVDAPDMTEPAAVAQAGPASSAAVETMAPTNPAGPGAASAAVATAAASAPSAPSAGVPPGGWPLSTRLTYSLTGHYQGPVEGQPSVEWLRQGWRYQVHVEVSVGPSFAPLVSRRLSSDGDITADGLSPRRYEEETRMAFRAPRRRHMSFVGPTVRLADGRQVLRPSGVQDTASQFVQLTWLFTLHPERLRTGETVPLMLALPQHVDRWVYDVMGQERLVTPVGAFDAVLVRPRQPARPGDLTAEMWVAPTLQHLPVRIVIRQDRETFVDLLLDRLPQQEADPTAGATADWSQASPKR